MFFSPLSYYYFLYIVIIIDINFFFLEKKNCPSFTLVTASEKRAKIVDEREATSSRELVIFRPEWNYTRGVSGHNLLNRRDFFSMAALMCLVLL